MIPPFLRALVAVGAVLLAASGVQAYPEKAVRIIVPYAPGGASDILARVLAQKLSERWGQQMIVENKAGSGGTLGADIVAKAAPDGYTLLLADVAVQTIAPALYPKLPYARADLSPVINLATFAHVVITAPNSPLGSIGDLLQRERARPGSTNVASSGNGTSTHLTAEMLNSVAGIRLNHVPYKGGGAALADVMSGQVDVMFIGSPPAMPLLQGGKLKAIAVTTSRRMAALPSVPTVAEAGLPGFESIAAQGVFAPKGTPREVVNALNREIARVIQLPDVRARWSQLGADPVDNTPAQFGDWLDSEAVKWTKVVRESGAKAD